MSQILEQCPLQEDDEILAINGNEVQTAAQLVRVLRAARDCKTLQIKVLRLSKEYFCILPRLI